MKRLILAIAVGVLFVAAVAQSPPKVPKYNPATEVSIRGDVVQIRDYPCPVADGIGRHITVRTAEGTLIEVHLAPAQFADANGLDLTLSPVVIVGSAVEINGTPTVLARTLTQHHMTYVLRDEQGKPTW